jgi:drug/metabolite transporter (DMT)-like permease
VPTGPSASGAPEPHAARDHASERRVAEAGVLLVVLCWAANFVIVKAAIGEVPPLVFTGLRYIVATATVLAILRWREGTIRMPLPDIAKAAALGVLGFAVYQACWTLGLTQITAGDSALLIAATPVIVALISVPLGTDTLSPAKIIGIFVSFLGVGLVVTAGADGALSLGSSLVGDLVTLVAAVVWAFYTSLAARLMRRMTPLQLTGWSVAGGCAALVPAAIWQAAVSPPFSIDLAVVAAIIYSGTLAAGVANILISRGVLVLGPTRVTVLQYGVPALAVVFGAIFLAEPVRPAQVLGGIVIILGVVITRGVPDGVFGRLRRGDAAA